MKKSLRTIFTALLFSMVMFTMAGCNGDSDSDTESKMKIVHINDTHSYLDGQSVSLEFDGVAAFTATAGGMAKVATVMNQLKAGNPDTLTLHAGDAVQGTVYYNLFKGQADADVLNNIGFDAMAVGNHEFDDGDSFLSGFIDKLGFPVLSANVVPAAGNTLDGKIKPYTIKSVNGTKVGIIGLTIAKKTKESSNPSDEITFNDETESVQKYVNELKNKGVRKIIVLSHYGYENDIALAAKVTDIDVIVGGDTHTLLGDFAYAGLESSGEYPTKKVNKDGDPVCIVQAWEHSKVVGELDVTFKGDRIASCSGTPHLLLDDASLARKTTAKDALPANDREAILAAIAAHGNNISFPANEATMSAIMQGYTEQVTTMKQTVIGSAATDLLHNRVPAHAYSGVNLPLGSDIAPIVAKSFYDLSNRADICIQNAGGVRVSVTSGNITMDTAYTLLPFDNTLYEIEMYGSEIKQVLEDAIEAIAQGGSDGGFPYAYALRYDVDATKAFGSRVSNLEVKNRATGAWSVIDNTKMYVVVTNSYTGMGKDGYTTFGTVQEQRGMGVNTYLQYTLSFIRYVEAMTAANKSVEKLPASDHPIKSYISTPSEDDKL